MSLFSSFFVFFFFSLAASRADEKLNPPMVELKVPCEMCYYASASLPSSQCAIGFQRHKEYLLIGSNLIPVQRNRPSLQASFDCSNFPPNIYRISTIRIKEIKSPEPFDSLEYFDTRIIRETLSVRKIRQSDWRSSRL